jgi:hypothetical protein
MPIRKSFVYPGPKKHFMKTHPRHRFFSVWLFIIPFIFFFQVTLGRAVFSGIDILKQHVPMKFYNMVAFKNGMFPLWNPVLCRGYPHFAEGQSGPLYIGNILMYLFPSDHFMTAYDYTVILHFVLGGLLCYAFFRRKNLNPLISFFASISVSFSPFMLLHSSAPSLHQVVVFFPLLLMIYDASLKKPFRNIVIGAMVTCTMLLIGHVQMVVYSFLALGVYVIFVSILASSKEESKTVISRSFLFYILIVISGGAMAAVQLVPTMEFSSLTSRTGGLAGNEFFGTGTWLSLPRLASIFVVPSLENNSDLLHYGSSLIYFGFFPVFMFLLAWRDQKFKRVVLPWIFAFAIMYLLAMGFNNPLNRLIVKIPPLNLFRYLGRYSFFAGFFLTYPLALAIQTVIEDGKSLIREGGFWRNIWKELALMFLLVVFMLLFARKIYPFLLLGLIYLLFQSVLFSGLIFAAYKRMRRDFLKLALLIHMLMFMGMGFMISNMTQIYTSRQQESLEAYGLIARHEFKNKSLFIATDRSFIVAGDLDNFLLTPMDNITYDAYGSAGLYTPWGIANMNAYTPLKVKRWQDLTDYIINRFKNWNPGEDTSYLEFLIYDVLGVNYLILSGKDWNLEKYELAVGPLVKGFDDQTYLYIARKEHPGFYFRQQDSTTELKLNEWDKYPDILTESYTIRERARVYLSDSMMYSRHISVIESGGKAYTAMMYRPLNPAFPQRTFHWDGVVEKFSIDDPEEKFDGILLQESVYPGWSAYVDGSPVQISSGDGIFKFIEFQPSKKHEIELEYFPRSFRIGLWISVISAWLCVILLIFSFMKFKRVKKLGGGS